MYLSWTNFMQNQTCRSKYYMINEVHEKYIHVHINQARSKGGQPSPSPHLQPKTKTKKKKNPPNFTLGLMWVKFAYMKLYKINADYLKTRCARRFVYVNLF